MNKLFNNITECIGNTPLVVLNKISKGLSGKIALKCEFFNPLSSVKDRIALYMIEDAEKEGKLKPGGLIVEPTSGNTGVGLAFVAASKGYKCVLTMPDTMSAERVLILKALGAEVILTPGSKGMKGAIERAEDIVSKAENAYMPQQFKNSSNPKAHYETTGPEIWEAAGGKVDFLVAGVGTGGSLSGIGSYLKEKNPDMKIVAVEPEGSPVLSGQSPGPHKIQGIGAGFIPDVLDKGLIDEIIKMRHEDAGAFALRLAREEGIFVGISAGANVCAAYKIASREENKNKLVVTIGCDTGERYLSTWLWHDDK
jgi:cysteine synthase A